MILIMTDGSPHHITRTAFKGLLASSFCSYRLKDTQSVSRVFATMFAKDEADILRDKPVLMVGGQQVEADDLLMPGNAAAVVQAFGKIGIIF